jgi:hypothetical protein
MTGQNFLKGSNDTSVPGKTAAGANRSNGEARNQPSPTIDGFALSGVSNLPDPSTHAYRKDLADVALAGRVIASHYAEPLVRHIVAEAPFLAEPADNGEQLAGLRAGDEIRMLDNSRGWAWGYGPGGRVGYVRSEAVAP